MRGEMLSVLSLNIWGGKMGRPLLSFIKTVEWMVDIFCFQEVFKSEPDGQDHWWVPDIFHQIEQVLPNHRGFYAPSQTDDFGLAMFIHQGIEVERRGDAFVHRWRDARVDNRPETLGRNLQFADLLVNGCALTIAHVHGLWTNGGKGDTSARLEQSAKIRMFRELAKYPLVLSGDLNLRQDTESLRLLGEGMTNLVQEYKIPTTRNSHYPGWKTEPHADYIFVDPRLAVESFRVPPVSVSDHLPLIATVWCR